MSPCFHVTSITNFKSFLLESFFTLENWGKMFEAVLKCKMFSKPPFLMMKKSPESFHRKPVVLFFRRRMYPQTSGCIAIPFNRQGFAISPFPWGCLKRHLSEIGMIVNPDRGINNIKLN